MQRPFSIATAMVLVVCGTALLVTPTAAETFTIELKNGSTFQSRYEPTEAEWDSSQIVFLDELGIRVALSKEDVAEVTAETETSGFGTVLDSTTIDLGYLPNDMPTAEQMEAGDQRSPGERLREQMQIYQEMQPSYDMQQFVEPGSAGGGIPVGAVPSQPSTSALTRPGGTTAGGGGG
ncbi:MAG: hypothetical protein R3234_01100 [Thermoanaerobaculia bacterium]|nr:hypothetical protein [Thermoanaerobaculia bacterium]